MFPGVLYSMDLIGFDATVEDVLQTLGPYMRDYFRRDPRFQDTLEASASSSPGSAAIFFTVVYRETTELELGPLGTSFNVRLADRPPPDVLEQLLVDLVNFIPRERVMCFRADLDTRLPEEPLSMMPNIKTLEVVGAELSQGFLQPNPDGPHANTKLLPSLSRLCLEDVILNGNDWSHLTTYLAHQTSDGQAILLEMAGELPYIGPEVVDEIERLVEGFVHYQPEGDSGAEEDV